MSGETTDRSVSRLINGGDGIHCPFCGAFCGHAWGKAHFVVAVDRVPAEHDGFDYRRCPNRKCAAWLKYEIIDRRSHARSEPNKTLDEAA
jgi:hypothetical protein